MYIKMKGMLETVFLLIAPIAAQINFIKLFLGGETPVPAINTVIQIGNVIKSNDNMTQLDMEATKNAIELSELLQNFFDVGIFPLPPLDPYRSDSRKRIVLSPQQYVNGSIEINSVSITGAKQFDLEDLQLRLNTGRVDYKVAIRELRIVIDNLVADLLVNGRPMNLQLKLSIVIDDLVLSGAFQAKQELEDLENNSIIQLVGAILTINSSNVRAAIVNNPSIDLFTSLRYLNQISSLPPMWWLDLKGDVEKFILEAVVEKINDILSNLSVEQVQVFLLPRINKLKTRNYNSKHLTI